MRQNRYTKIKNRKTADILHICTVLYIQLVQCDAAVLITTAVLIAVKSFIQSIVIYFERKSVCYESVIFINNSLNS